MYSTVFWHTPGILCHSTSTHASRFMRGCRYPPEIGGEEGYAKCTSEVTRSGSEHCNLPRVCVDIWGVTLAMDPVEWISWIFVCKIVMCCHPPGGCWLSNTTKGWVSWKKWWLKVGRYAHLLNPETAYQKMLFCNSHKTRNGENLFKQMSKPVSC